MLSYQQWHRILIALLVVGGLLLLSPYFGLRIFGKHTISELRPESSGKTPSVRSITNTPTRQRKTPAKAPASRLNEIENLLN